MLTIIGIKFGVIGHREIKVCLKIRMRGIDTIIHHTDGDTRTAVLAI